MTTTDDWTRWPKGMWKPTKTRTMIWLCRCIPCVGDARNENTAPTCCVCNTLRPEDVPTAKGTWCDLSPHRYWTCRCYMAPLHDVRRQLACALCMTARPDMAGDIKADAAGDLEMLPEDPQTWVQGTQLNGIRGVWLCRCSRMGERGCTGDYCTDCETRRPDPANISTFAKQGRWMTSAHVWMCRCAGGNHEPQTDECEECETRRPDSISAADLAKHVIPTPTSTGEAREAVAAFDARALQSGMWTDDLELVWKCRCKGSLGNNAASTEKCTDCSLVRPARLASSTFEAAARQVLVNEIAELNALLDAERTAGIARFVALTELRSWLAMQMRFWMYREKGLHDAMAVQLAKCDEALGTRGSK